MTGPLHGLRIGLLTASASRAGGGVFEAVLRQAAMIRDLGGEAPVFALRDGFSDADEARFAPGSVTNLPVRGPRQIGYAPSLVAALLEADLDLLHLHGIWMYPSRAGSRWAHLTGRPYVISPHGMLDPWITARGRWKKAIARSGYERTSWCRAIRFHALTSDEADDIARESGRDRISVIPNAAPVVDPLPITSRLPRMVYLGRIHSKKNLDGLVQAWNQAVLPPEARLIVAGWGNPRDVTQLRAAIAAGKPSIEFIGPVFGANKQDLLRSARFAILPSLSEGLPMSLLEGWSAAAPSIQTAACHLPEAVAVGAAFSCNPDPAELARTIEVALSLDNESWLAMARAAQCLAAGPFSAETIAARWAATYREAMNANEGFRR